MILHFSPLPGNGSDGLSEQSVRDMVDLFCLRDPGELYVVVDHVNSESPATRGLFIVARNKCIVLYDSRIRTDVQQGRPVGGNSSIAPTVELGFAYVLRHELQHLNQYMLADGVRNAAMGVGRYRGRPAEVDARASVDRDRAQIDALFGATSVSVATQRVEGDPMEDLCELLCSMGPGAMIDRAEIREELRARGLNSPHNFGRIVGELRSSGVEVT